MRPSQQKYDQPEKQETRQRAIARAVKSLAADRSSSPVVTQADFDRTLDYCLQLLNRSCDTKLRQAIEDEAGDWRTLQRSRIGTKNPEDLTVLFLAGPDPKPDLLAFKQSGVPFSNIWAVESDKETFHKAVKLLQAEGLSVKFYQGGLQKFFAVSPQQFDIVYFDSCSPLFGGDPNTIHVIRELFVNQRLSPLSVLITNFSEPYPKLDPAFLSRTALRVRLRNSPKALAKLATAADNAEIGLVGGKLTDTDQNERELLKWANMLGLWAYANGDNDTWTQHLSEFVEFEILPDLLPPYSQFTTEFIIRFAGQLLPWWRVVALPGSRKEYFADNADLAKAIEAAEGAYRTWDNPLYSALRHVLFTQDSDKGGPWRDFYFNASLEQTKLGEAVKATSLIRTFFESQWGDTFGHSTAHIRNACSKSLVSALETFKWFDHQTRMFCNDPLPHLLTDLLTGLYGHPYHCNTRKLDRIAYKARETTMFTDVFVFDQARYLYELLPTLPLFDHKLPVPRQLTLRICMDAIRRHAHYGCPDLFYMSDLAGSGEDSFTYWQPPARESIGCAVIEKPEEDSQRSDVPF